MIGLPDHVRTRRSIDVMPDAQIASLPDAEERELVRNVSAREDTFTLSIADADDKLLGYMVAGVDDNDMVTVYAARSMVKGLAAVAFKAIFGASQIAGKPVRVHTTKLRAFARQFGADEVLSHVDTDGLPMGVFSG